MPDTVGVRPRCLTTSQTSSALSPCDEGHRLRLNHHPGVLLPNTRKSVRSLRQYCQRAPGQAETLQRISCQPSLPRLLWSLDASVVSSRHRTNAKRGHWVTSVSGKNGSNYRIHVSVSVLGPQLPSFHSHWSSDVYAWPCSSSPKSPSLHGLPCRQSDIFVAYGSRAQRQYCRLAIACLLARIILAQLSVNVQ